MNMMLLMTDDQSCLLKESDNRVRFSVYHMSPLVALVGHDSNRYSKYDHPIHQLRCE